MSTKTVAVLKMEAKEKHIKGYYKMNRAELCQVLGYKDCGKKVSPHSPQNKTEAKKPVTKPKSKVSVKNNKKDSDPEPLTRAQYNRKYNKKGGVKKTAVKKVSVKKAAVNKVSVKKNKYITGNENQIKVVINKKHVWAYPQLDGRDQDDSDNEDDFEKEPVLDIECEKIFIGKDLQDRKDDGNTIVLHIKAKKYIYIGDTIYSFESKYPIKEYFSPLGNGGYPYPYAVDSDKNYYLMVENVILVNLKGDEDIGNEDPYEIYYDNRYDKSSKNVVPLNSKKMF